MPTCGLQSGESNRVSIKYQVEDPACYGKLRTAGTRITKGFRVTSPDMPITKESKISEEIRPDNQVAGTFALSATSDASFDYEFSRGTIDDFVAGYLGREKWTKDMTMHITRGVAVSISANNTILVQSTDLTSLLAANDKIKLEGFLTPANNNYFTVTAVAFAAGVTTITTTETTMVIEAGNARGTIMDANDVIISGTTLQTDAAGFNAGGGAVFGAAIAAGLLEPGRVLYAQGLGLEEATIDITTNPVVGETFTVVDASDDTGNTIVFEFVATAGLGTLGNTEIVLGATPALTGTAIEKALMTALNSNRLLVSATSVTGATTIVTLRNLKRLGTGSLTGALTGTVVTNFAGGDATVNGYFTILSATATQINVSPAPTLDANAGAKFVVLKGSHVAPPAKVADIQKISHQIERNHTDLNQVFLYRGQRVEGIDLEMTAGDLIGGKVSFGGSKVTNGQTSVLGVPPYTQIDTLTTPVYNATLNVKNVQKDGAVMPVTVMGFKLNMTKDLRKQYGLSNYWNVGTGLGQLAITASLETYFQDVSLYNDFINNTEFSLDIVLEDTDRCGYFISIPRAFPSSDAIALGSLDEDIMETIDITANIDTSLSNAMIVFNRFSSILPPTA